MIDWEGKAREAKAGSVLRIPVPYHAEGTAPTSKDAQAEAIPCR